MRRGLGLVLLGDGRQWWPKGEQREREKFERERRGRQTSESGRVRETKWREKNNKIIFLVLQ